MRLTGPEEAGDPDPVRPFVVIVGVQELFEAFLDFVGQYVFFDFEAKTGFIVGFDNAFNGAVNGL